MDDVPNDDVEAAARLDAKIEAKLQRMLDEGKLQLVEGLANLGRSLGMSTARVRQGLRKKTEACWLTDCLILWKPDGREVVAWTWYDSGRWAALVPRDDPRPPEEVPPRLFLTPPAADQPVPMADGSENSTPSSGASEGDTYDSRAICWRRSRRGNSYIDEFQGCHLVVWCVLDGWRFHVVHKATKVTWQGNASTEDEAKTAALDKLAERLPEFLQRLAAERSRKAGDAG